MKSGDKLYCKKELYVANFGICFTLDKCYKVASVDVCYLFIQDNDGDNLLFYFYKDKVSDRVCNDYFYTEQELRKLKLDRLNEERMV